MSELRELVAKQNEESYQLGKKHGAIEELEKAKTKIQHERSKHSGEGKYTYTAGLKVSIDIIDNLISELKGEDNG